MIQGKSNIHKIDIFLPTQRLLNSNAKSFWRPEYGSFMLEGTPAKPYHGISTLLQVQESMEGRRSLVKSLLKVSNLN